MAKITNRGEIEVPHPRGGTTFREMPAETQAAAHEYMDRMHAEAVPKMQHIIGGEIKSLQEGINTKGGGTEAKRTRLDSLNQTMTDLSKHPGAAMEASVNRVTQTAMAPVLAARSAGKEVQDIKDLPSVSAGEFYGARQDIGTRVISHYFPKGTEEFTRGELATPEWSARTTPQQEISGASGMLAILKHGEHIDFSIGESTANLLNAKAPEGGFHGGHGGEGPITPGDYNFSHLAQHYPQAAAILLQHHAREQGVTAPGQKSKYTPERLAITQQRRGILSASSTMDLPEDLHPAARAMISGMGQTGFPKAARSMSRFYSDPETFGGHAQHKIPSYTWNIHRHDPVMAAGTHHFLGVLAHGDKWLERLTPKVTPLYALLSLIQPGTTRRLPSTCGRARWPVAFPSTPRRSWAPRPPIPRSSCSVGCPSGRGLRYGSPADMGYFWGEEAHRQAASKMSINVKGIGKMNAPAHVVQSLSWYGVQAEENANQIRSGGRTLVPTGMNDPKSLNSLQFPTVFGAKARSRK